MFIFLLFSHAPDFPKTNPQQMSLTLTPNAVRDLLAADPLALESLKTDPSMPKEAVVSSALGDSLAAHPNVPKGCHAEDHIGYWTRDQINIAKTVLEFMEGWATNAARDKTTEEDIQFARYEAIHSDPEFIPRLEAALGRRIKQSRQTSYLGSIWQLKIEIPPTWSRKVYLPTTKVDGSPQDLVLHVRHTKSPCLAFLTPLTEDIKPYMTQTTTFMMTVRYGTPEKCTIGMGTGYAGGDDVQEWPGADIVKSGEGIFYKWYPSEEARSKDAQLFVETLKTVVPALIEPEAFQRLVMEVEN